MTLDDRIQSELAEGQGSESGRFTMTLEAMVARMQLQGTGESWWMARLIQAAVASGCACLDIRKAGRLDFETRDAWSAELIYAALTHPERPVERWLEHLRRGLWVCGWQEHRAWKFHLPGRELCLQDGQLTLQNCSGQATSLHVLTQIDQFSLVAAHPSPIAVHFHSKRIKGIDEIRPQLLTRSQPGVHPSLTVAPGGDHLLHWVEDGVILESQPIWPGLAQVRVKVWGYADAAGLPRDASGYRLIQGPEFKQRCLEAQKELARQLQDLQPPAPQVGKVSRMAPMTWGARAAGVTWVTGWLLGDPGLGTLMSCFAGAMGMVFGSIQVDTEAVQGTVPEEDRVELLKLKDSLARWYYDH